jgi:hypothetical protein
LVFEREKKGREGVGKVEMSFFVDLELEGSVLYDERAFSWCYIDGI